MKPDHHIGIVGSQGFIGKNLQKQLGHHHKIFCFTSGKPLNLNVPQIREQLMQIDTIIWAASRVNPSSAENSPLLAKAELEEWRKTLSDLRNIGWFGHLIFLSSGGCVYGDSSSPFKEQNLANGINAYGRLKVSMEKELEDSGVLHTILRVANVYGPLQPHGRGQGVIAEWKNRIELGEPLLVFGNIESYRDYIHVFDVCEAIEISLNFNKSNTYNLGSGKPTTIRQLLDNFTSFSGRELKVEFSPTRIFDRSGFFLDMERFTSRTHWQPNYEIAQGIASLFSSQDRSASS
jgi:UDP-glucose 4-epimerase